MESIGAIARSLGLEPKYLIAYGDDKAKVSLDAIKAPHGKLIAVTGITPTSAGEGKTTTAIGLTDALAKAGRKAVVTLRQPSLGPVFGVKGGGTGGGWATVVPEADINLHFTGDSHAVTTAHNLLAALTDNAVRRHQIPDLTSDGITWRRVSPIEDRALRNIVTGLGGDANSPVRDTGFDITEASEVMAILSLATGYDDLRKRLGAITVGYTTDKRPVRAGEIGAVGSMMALLKDAMLPNLVQTGAGQPAFVHTGPFANIAHGNSSILADLIGIKTSEYLLTEAGFGADIGAEKFFNIKCRYSGLRPDAAVLVATVRAMKLHTGKHRVVPGRPLPDAMLKENPDEVYEGAANLRKQIQNIRAHGVSPVVCVNHFTSDFDSEVEAIRRVAAEEGARCAVSTHWAEGGAGAIELAKAVIEAAEEPTDFNFLYELNQPIKAKIEKIATTIYGADGVSYEAEAERQIRQYESAGFGKLPICMAKTHLSLSHDPALKGAPTGFTVPIREVRASVGAGFIYPLLGQMRTMPGLSSSPAAEKVDIDFETGQVVGLF